MCIRDRQSQNESLDSILIAKEINQTHPSHNQARRPGHVMDAKGIQQNNLASIHDTLLSSQGPNTPQHPPHTQRDLVQGRSTTLHHPRPAHQPAPQRTDQITRPEKKRLPPPRPRTHTLQSPGAGHPAGQRGGTIHTLHARRKTGRPGGPRTARSADGMRLSRPL